MWFSPPIVGIPFFHRLHKMFSNSSLTWNIVLLLMASFPTALLPLPLLEVAPSMPAAAHAGGGCHWSSSSVNLLVLKYIFHSTLIKMTQTFFWQFLTLEWFMYSHGEMGTMVVLVLAFITNHMALTVSWIADLKNISTFQTWVLTEMFCKNQNIKFYNTAINF